jgi:hypothetical protein
MPGGEPTVWELQRRCDASHAMVVALKAEFEQRYRDQGSEVGAYKHRIDATVAEVREKTYDLTEKYGRHDERLKDAEEEIEKVEQFGGHSLSMLAQAALALGGGVLGGAILKLIFR